MVFRQHQFRVVIVNVEMVFKWCSNGVQMMFRQHQFRVVLKNTGIGYVQFTLSKEMESVRTEGAPGWHRAESEASPLM